MTRICLIPKVHGVGGMVSFQAKLTAGLKERGIQVCDDLGETPYAAVLITGGTRNLAGVWRARHRGIRIVQRLDGINWLHRRQHTGWRHALRAESANWLLTFLRSRLATRLVYQSEFVRSWWQDWFGPGRVSATVIHNGVDLAVYTPEGPEKPAPESCRVLVVEGSLGGVYDQGLATAVQLAELLGLGTFSIELIVVGRVTPAQQDTFRSHSRVPILWAGLQPPERIPALDRSAHLLYSADLNAACPNSVIEAMACGLPVVAFQTGALPEMVKGGAGRLVPYGDPWKLEPPDLSALAEAGAQVLSDQPSYRKAARRRAEEAFDLEHMVDQYLHVLLE